VSFGASFAVGVSTPSSIKSVVLLRPGACTHSFNMNQRLVGLAFTSGASTLTVTAPPDGNIALPGFYMLFVVNQAGAPSTAKFIKVT
jgi:hypothetical protein